MYYNSAVTDILPNSFTDRAMPTHKQEKLTQCCTIASILAQYNAMCEYTLSSVLVFARYGWFLRIIELSFSVCQVWLVLTNN